MDERAPAYYAIIPANVRYDDSIPANAKLMYGEISALINSDGFCFASNQYFADLYGVTTKTISRLVSALEQAGYITTLLEKSSAGLIERRKIYLKVSMLEEHPLDNFVHTSGQNCGGGMDKNVQGTDISNTVYIKENKKEKSGKKVSEKKSASAGDFDPLERFTAWISENLPDRPREEKNALYLALARFCESRTANKHPVKSQGSVTALCNRLMRFSGGDIAAMVDMLDTATSSGWRSVYPPGGQKRDAPAAQGREWECL